MEIVAEIPATSPLNLEIMNKTELKKLINRGIKLKNDTKTLRNIIYRIALHHYLSVIPLYKKANSYNGLCCSINYAIEITESSVILSDPYSDLSKYAELELSGVGNFDITMLNRHRYFGRYLFNSKDTEQRIKLLKKAIQNTSRNGRTKN